MTGRPTTCLTDGRLEDAAGVAIDSAGPGDDCGSMAMLKDMCDLLVGGICRRFERTAGWICHRGLVG